MKRKAAMIICLVASVQMVALTGAGTKTVKAEEIVAESIEEIEPTAGAGIVFDTSRRLLEPEEDEKTASLKEESKPELNISERCLLEATVESEAGNQPLDGKRAVVAVVLNRVEDPDFPDTIDGVITQKYQFSTFWNGAIDGALEKGVSDSTKEAVEREINERTDEYRELLFFNCRTFPVYGTPWGKIGDHYFCSK